MIPVLLKLYLEKANIFPSDEIVKLVEKHSVFDLPKFIDVLVDLAYGDIDNTDLHEEAKVLINLIVESIIGFEMLRHLFSLQGPNKDKELKTSNGTTIIRALPEWKRNAFDSLIRRISYKTSGLRHLMVTLSEMMGQDRSPKAAFEVAKCICRPPSGVTDTETHYRQLSSQIIDLLTISNVKKILNIASTDKHEHADYLRFGHCVGLECVHLCTRINTQYAQKYILDVLFEDFYRITDPELSANIDEAEIVALQSSQLMATLNLHSSLLNSFAPSIYVQSQMRDFSALYINIATALTQKDNTFTPVATQIITRLIELLHGQNGSTLDFIKSLAALDDSHTGRVLNRKLTVRPCLDRENIEIVWIDSFVDDDCERVRASEEINNTLVAILQALSEGIKKDIVSSLFLWLLECRFNVKRTIITKNNDREELVADYRDHLLTLLCTEMESHCFTKSTDVLTLANIVITRYCDGKAEPGNVAIVNDHLNYALNMVVIILSMGKLRDDDRPIFDQMFTILQALRDTHPLEQTRDLITDICIIIATRGHTNYLCHTSLIEEECLDEELNEAFKDCESEQTYLMGHGLTVLNRLLIAKNQSALKMSPKIYSLLSNLLFHSESYIYLRVIGGLSALGSEYTAKMLPMLAQRLRSLRAQNSLLRGNDYESSLEEWMKFSEVFMKIIRSLGEMSAKYRDIILSTLLSGLRDEEEIVRASSLSNLSDLCCQNDYVMGSVIYEVVNSVCGMLVHDQSVLVKNAASLVIRRLLLGPNDCPRPEIMTLFPGDILLAMHRSLRSVLDNETNESILDHASVAYASLDDSVRLFLFPSARPAHSLDTDMLEGRLRLPDWL